MILTQRFPVQISLGGNGGPEFSTDIVSVESGDEYRNANRQFPLRRYDVSHGARTEKLARQLIAYFHVARGRLNPFPFKDWADFTVKAGEGGFVAIDGSPGGYQMFKRYAVGDDFHDRTITRPLVETLAIDGNSGGAIDPDTGILTGGTGVPTGWTGEFDILARFDTDVMPIAIINKQPDGGFIYSWPDIPILEVRA